MPVTHCDFPSQSDILDVNQIFKDLAVLVHEQGEIIGAYRIVKRLRHHFRCMLYRALSLTDSIEANVDSAQVNVEHATTQLSQARTYQVKKK